jgi:hypothetical protein
MHKRRDDQANVGAVVVGLNQNAYFKSLNSGTVLVPHANQATITPNLAYFIPFIPTLATWHTCINPFITTRAGI